MNSENQTSNKIDMKKIVVSTLLMVIIFLILIVGATYAYFTVTSPNNFGSKVITSTTPKLGSVAIAPESNLIMNITANHMLAGSSDVTYYASSNGTTTTETTENIGTVTVSGDGTFKCDYTISIDDNSNSLYDSFQNMSTKSPGQMILVVNGAQYDFNTASLFPNTISGTMTGLTSTNSQNITAQLKLINKANIDQTSLAGKNITLTFTVSNFSCSATA